MAFRVNRTYPNILRNRKQRIARRLGPNRRFDPGAIETLLEALNATRQRVWKAQPAGFREHAFIDTDVTIGPSLW
jgi:hypothetical protein